MVGVKSLSSTAITACFKVSGISSKGTTTLFSTKRDDMVLPFMSYRREWLLVQWVLVSLQK